MSSTVRMCFALLVASSVAVAAGPETKTTEVKVKDLSLNVPADWKQVKSASRMRLATFEIPAAKGDADTGELTIFSFGGGGGSVAANLSRWVGQFGGEGKTAKATKGTAGDNEYYFVDITGTFNKSVGPPVLRKTEAKQGYRMYGVILVLEGKGVYYLKLTGPDATVKAQADGFRSSFGGKADSETDFEI